MNQQPSQYESLLHERIEGDNEDTQSTPISVPSIDTWPKRCNKLMKFILEMWCPLIMTLLLIAVVTYLIATYTGDGYQDITPSKSPIK